MDWYEATIARCVTPSYFSSGGPGKHREEQPEGSPWSQMYAGLTKLRLANIVRYG